ncbi:RING-H2 finger protein ATL3-like [Cicer arietinum]|uniref:RING-type E3 ubiquitin transferase n=1 Tax=Cicer arietinum TaxID=3827 RepID=A0A1S2XWV7_CICAR|nr:RING-H2 finger protein ATL3-like [Cicer arietinum]
MSDMRSDNLGYSPAVDITGKIMVVVIIILFLIVVTFVFFHLYAKGIWWSDTIQNNSQSQRPQQRGGGSGLDPELLKSLPVTVYQSDGLELMECAVCLSEVVEGEKVRILGKCNHVFHVDCIDMWFHSHSTCPLCRTTVEPFQELQLPLSSSSSTFPTNVLIWGNHNNNQIITSSSSTTASASFEENKTASTSASSSSLGESGRDNGILVIDIPNDCERDYECEVSSSSSSSSPSPSTGGGGRLRSLKRLLSSSRGIMSLNPWSPTSTSTSTDVKQAKPSSRS